MKARGSAAGWNMEQEAAWEGKVRENDIGRGERVSN
jgi:hypothetical protein